jgi:hypothetical protein
LISLLEEGLQQYWYHYYKKSYNIDIITTRGFITTLISLLQEGLQQHWYHYYRKGYNNIDIVATRGITTTLIPLLQEGLQQHLYHCYKKGYNNIDIVVTRRVTTTLISLLQEGLQQCWYHYYKRGFNSINIITARGVYSNKDIIATTEAYYNTDIVKNGRAAWLTKTWVFRLDTGFIVHLLLTTLVLTVYSMAFSPNYTIIVYIALIHTVYSLSVIYYTRAESSWYAVALVLGYRLPTAGIPLPCLTNFHRRRATATLDSRCCD